MSLKTTWKTIYELKGVSIDELERVSIDDLGGSLHIRAEGCFKDELK